MSDLPHTPQTVTVQFVVDVRQVEGGWIGEVDLGVGGAGRRVSCSAETAKEATDAVIFSALGTIAIWMRVPGDEWWPLKDCFVQIEPGKRADLKENDP